MFTEINSNAATQNAALAAWGDKTIGDVLDAVYDARGVFLGVPFDGDALAKLTR